LTGVAVKVTEPPVHIAVALAAIVTEGVTDVVVMVTGLLVSVVGLAQGSLDVMITVTTSLLTSVVEVNDALVAPVTLTPLICHW
jgi:phage-related protein